MFTPVRLWFRKLPFGQSRLGRLIFGLNLVGLIVLIVGAMVLNELRQGLINTQKDSLTAQAALMGRMMGAVATGDGPVAQLDAGYANLVLAEFIPPGQRARLFDAEGRLISDSYVVSEGVDVRDLPPARDLPQASDAASAQSRNEARDEVRREIERDVAVALTGEPKASVRFNERGEKVVSVSIPIQRVRSVLGVLTLERGGVDEIVSAQRMAMMPFILVALGVSILSSFLLSFLVSRPIQRLSAAADSVRLEKARAISLPDLESRRDEIGTLTRSLSSMTATLSRRMDEIDRFAADVSHEIKNPLTSIRSALETLNLVKDEAAKARLMAVINQDVQRADRLITDISNASRLDAELARDTPRTIDIGTLLEDVISLYQASHMPGEVSVSFRRLITPVASRVEGREGPLGQVFRNLIDNARSFSPEGGDVAITIAHSDADPERPLSILFEDQGPGIPEENLETIFQRFYTSRPKGTTFGKNSGLGLSISRQIVEAHQGRIWAENIKDADGRVKGARFTILLPNAY